MSDLTPEQMEARIKQLSGYLVKEEERVIELQAQVAALEAVLDKLVEILDVAPDFTSPEFMQRRILEAIEYARSSTSREE